MQEFVILDFVIPKIRLIPNCSTFKFWEAGVGTWQLWADNQNRPLSRPESMYIAGCVEVFCSVVAKEHDSRLYTYVWCGGPRGTLKACALVVRSAICFADPAKNTLVLRPAVSAITFWLAITCCEQNPLEASNVLPYLLWQEQLSFQAVENSLILQKFLVGVASLCYKEIGVQTAPSD